MTARLNTPVQVTLESEPTLVKPVLQVQTTSNVPAAWEQTAFRSHPPLLTRQLSADAEENRVVNPRRALRVCVPVQTTLDDEPMLVYPVLQTQMAANVVGSCAQTALPLHPPLLIKQLSRMHGRADEDGQEQAGRVGHRTCAVESGTGTSIGVADLASASNGVSGRIVATDGVIAAATVVDGATV